MRNLINQQRNIKNLNPNEHLNLENIDDAKIKSNLTGIGSEDIEYIMINWVALEEIMLNDFNSFKMI